MLSQLDDLYGSQIASLDTRVRREGYLRQADSARVGVISRALDGERTDHGVGHVLWAVVWAVCAEAEVDVYDGEGVASEPAWLESDCAAGSGPVCAVSGGSHAAAWETEKNGMCQSMCIVLLIKFGLSAPHHEMRREEMKVLSNVHGYIHCMP